jgi:antirestriction protein ArdC
MSEKADLYTRITDKIIADLEAGTLTWMQPWQAGHAAGPVSRPLRANGMPYHGINVLALWMAAMEGGYSAPIWMTYKQAQELGGQVRKGERGTQAVYANAYTKTETGDDGEEVEKRIPFLKTYTVFNVEQIDGLPGHFYAPAHPVTNDNERIAAAEAFFAATGATVRHGGTRAYYDPSDDHVQMPRFETFRDGESYYGTLAHEVTHWTKHPARLNREFGRKRFTYPLPQRAADASLDRDADREPKSDTAIEQAKENAATREHDPAAYEQQGLF